MRRSSSSMTPALSASPTSILISSSVTVLSLSELAPKSRKITRVEVLSSQTPEPRPREISASAARPRRRRSPALRRASCLGTSSPITIEKIGDEADDDAEAERLGDTRRDALFRPGSRQPSAQGRARKGAGQDAHEGDADLDGREEAARILHQRQGDSRPGAAFLGHGLEAGAAGGDDGEFRKGKDAVEGDEADSDDEFEQRSQELPTASGRVSPLLWKDAFTMGLARLGRQL